MSSKIEEQIFAMGSIVQGVQRMLEDLADKRWPDKDHDLTGGYVSANIGHAAAGAKYHLPEVGKAIIGLNELLGEVERLEGALTQALSRQADQGVELASVNAELAELKERCQRNSDQAMEWMSKHDAARAQMVEQWELLQKSKHVVERARAIDKQAFSKGTQNVDHGLFRGLGILLEQYDAAASASLAPSDCPFPSYPPVPEDRQLHKKPGVLPRAHDASMFQRDTRGGSVDAE